MWHRTFILLCLGFLILPQGAQAFLHRAHIQWQVSDSLRKEIEQSHGFTKVHFGDAGQPIVEGLSPRDQKRLTAFYKLCMSDGCTFCDHPKGSCHNQTCGPENKFCKPKLSANGAPQCGIECAYYALSRL